MELDLLGNEIYTSAENRERLKATEAWSVFTSRLDMSDSRNVTLLNWLIEERLEEESPLTDYERLIQNIVAAGGVVKVRGERYEFVEVPVVESIVEPEAPVHRGQQLWAEYRQFSETHSMQECRNRARTDAGFASFMQKNYERESGQVADGVQNLNAKAQQAEQIPGNVKAFADNYRTMPTSEIRRQSRYDANPGGAKEFNFLRDEAIRLGLI